MDCSRREFFGLGSGALMAAALPTFKVESDSPPRTQINKAFRRSPLLIHRHRIEVGASAPFKALHVSDSHLTLCNSRENDPRKVELSMRRSSPWPSNWHYFEEAVHHARENGEMLLHTGDLIDFVSIANLEAAGRAFCDDDWFVCAGNHEYSKYVGEAREDEKYKQDSYARVQGIYPNDLTLASRVVNGVNFVAIDDVYMYVPGKAVERFRNEVEKGLPIVVMCHCPLFSEEFYEYEIKRRGRVNLVAMTDDTAKGRKRNADPTTYEFVRYLRSEKAVKAVLSGHIHFHCVNRFSETAIQYTGGCGAEGVVSSLEFV